jgi:hypothetical protein
MLNKLILTFTIAGVVAAFAATGTYRVNILQDSVVEGKQIKAGDYKIAVENNTAVLKHGRQSIEVAAHTEQSQSKYSNTQVRYVDNAISEIHVGGTMTKIVFTGGSGSTAGGSN